MQNADPPVVRGFPYRHMFTQEESTDGLAAVKTDTVLHSTHPDINPFSSPVHICGFSTGGFFLAAFRCFFFFFWISEKSVQTRAPTLVTSPFFVLPSSYLHRGPVTSDGAHFSFVLFPTSLFCPSFPPSRPYSIPSQHFIRVLCTVVLIFFSFPLSFLYYLPFIRIEPSVSYPPVKKTEESKTQKTKKKQSQQQQTEEENRRNGLRFPNSATDTYVLLWRRAKSFLPRSCFSRLRVRLQKRS